MTELLEKVVERIRALPPARQDELALVMLSFAEGDAVYQLTAEEEADLAEAEDEIARGEIASDAEVAAVFAKFRP